MGGSNDVYSTVTDLTSIARFIEDVFLDGRRIGGGSFDAIAGPLNHLFGFASAPNLTPLLLDEQTGQRRPGGIVREIERLHGSADSR